MASKAQTTSARPSPSPYAPPKGKAPATPLNTTRPPRKAAAAVEPAELQHDPSKPVGALIRVNRTTLVRNPPPADGKVGIATAGRFAQAPLTEGMGLSGPAASIPAAASACYTPPKPQPPTLAEAFAALSRHRLFAAVAVILPNGQRGTIQDVRPDIFGRDEHAEIMVRHLGPDGSHCIRSFTALHLSPAT